MPEDAGPPSAVLSEFVRGLDPVERALDLGCGDGRVTELLRASVVTGADVSGVALSRFSARLPEASAVRVELDAPLPFDDSSFELVLCTETIEHVRDVQLFLSEIRRVLRPGGSLALTAPAHAFVVPLRSLDPLSPHIRFFSSRSLRRLLDAMGFEVVSARRRRGTLMVRARRA